MSEEMQSLDTRALALLAIGLGPDGGYSAEGLGGITRLQKYLFLLENEESIHPASSNDFNFIAYKAGPYSSKLYDDLEFLENLGLIESEVTAEATDAEKTEVSLLSFDDLIGDNKATSDSPSADSSATADSFEERKFRLTKRGKDFVEKILQDQGSAAAVKAVRKIKKRFIRHSLTELLRYVYLKFPEMTVESEIKNKILGR